MLSLQGVDPTNFSLVEVMLDRGVSEREMGGGEYPWMALEQGRKVGQHVHRLCVTLR